MLTNSNEKGIMLISELKQRGKYLKSESGKDDVYHFYEIDSEIFVYSGVSSSYSALGAKIEAIPIDKFQ